MGKGTEGQGQTLQPTDHEWTVPKATKSCNAGGAQEEEKVNENGGHCRCGGRRRPRQHSRGFSSSRGKPPLYQYEESGRLPGLPEADCA